MELLAAIDTTGVTVMVPTLQSYFNVSGQAAGWLLMAYLIPFSLSLVPTGYFADKLGKPEKILLWSTLGFGISSLLCSVAPTANSLILFRIMKGISAGGMFATEFAVILKYWEEPRRTVEMAVAGLGLGVIIGPLVGGAFSSAELWRYFFLIGFVLSVGSFAAYLKLNNLVPIPREIDESTTENQTSLLKLIAWGSILEFIVAYGTQGLNLLITLHVQETLNKSPLFNGLILTVIAIGILVTNALGLGSKLFRDIKSAAWGSGIVLAVLMSAISLLTNWVNPTAFVVYLLIGATLGISMSTIELMILQSVPTSRLALANGILIALMQAGYALASGTIPLLYPVLGVQSVYVLAVSIGVLAQAYLAKK
ncbi:MAG: MFS transporter [Candidatus Harrisonbacteria bacterium]|nr:MFS transporter [Candidatus Harrisonbacteria bacterium]